MVQGNVGAIHVKLRRICHISFENDKEEAFENSADIA